MKLAQNGFVGGELSYPMYGRPDDSHYAYGVAEARNFLVRPQGTLRSRPGFEYVTACKYPSRKVRLIPFQFSSSDTAVLEFGHCYVRFIIDGAVLINSDGTPYEIESPYEEDELFEIRYDQSADVLTLTHPYHSVRTLTRYGAYDWRFESIDFSEKISAPENVAASAYYPEELEDETSSVYGYTSEDMDIIESTYCVTSVDEDGNESSRSETATTKGNFYITGAYNEITWDAVADAVRYNVYRKTGGIYGFIGETDETSIQDDNISPDTTQTPPTYIQPFAVANGIKSVTVTNGGSDYPANETVYVIPSTLTLPIVGWNCAETTSSTGLSLNITLSESDGTYAVSTTASLTRSNYGSNSNSYVWPATADIGNGTFTVTIDAPHQYSNPIVAIDDLGAGFVFGDPEDWPWLDLTGVSLIRTSNVAKRMVSGGASLSSIINETGQTDIAVESTGGVSLSVSDSTGSGASLKATVSGGQITAVKVLSSGANYTSPTITVNSSTGSGARFSVTLYSDGGDGQAPTALGLFEQRRWFAGTINKPLAIWATTSGTLDTMTRHYPTLTSDDSISVQADTRDANRILHIVPLSDLIMFTGTAEWRICASDGGAITPTNISVKPQSYYGANSVQPIIASNQCVYAAARGGHLREIGYSRDVYGYLTNDLSIRATHLFDNYSVDDMCYLKSPYPRINCVSSSGNLNICTYMPEQSINAWAHCTTQSGAFESCATVPDGDSASEDSLYVVVRRIINGSTVRYIERMGEINDTSATTALGLDSCLIGSFATPVTRVSGLSHLEGCTVGVQCDGVSYSNLTVSNGSLTLPVSSSYVIVGLPIDYRIETLPILTATQGYGKGRIKNIGKIYVQTIYTGSLKVGPSEDQMTTVLREFHNRYTDEPAEEHVHEYSCVVRGKWGELGQLIVIHDDYSPIEITSWAADVEMIQ